MFYVYIQVEYILVKFDDENKTARVALRAADLLPILNQREADNPTGTSNIINVKYHRL